MSNKGREARRHVEKCLEEFAVARPYSFGITGGSHQEVRFTHAGKSFRYIFPGSYSDHRALKNTRAGLRKILRAAEGEPVPGGPEARPVLDAGRVLPRQPHHVGGRGDRVLNITHAISMRGYLSAGPSLFAPEDA